MSVAENWVISKYMDIGVVGMSVAENWVISKYMDIGAVDMSVAENWVISKYMDIGAVVTSVAETWVISKYMDIGVEDMNVAKSWVISKYMDIGVVDMSVAENWVISKYMDIGAVVMSVAERWAVCQSDPQFTTYLCWNKYKLVEALFFRFFTLRIVPLCWATSLFDLGCHGHQQISGTLIWKKLLLKRVSECAWRKEIAIIPSLHTMHENTARWANEHVWAAKLLTRLMWNVAKTLKSTLCGQY